jgi:hypothetical protein
MEEYYRLATWKDQSNIRKFYKKHDIKFDFNVDDIILALIGDKIIGCCTLTYDEDRALSKDGLVDEDFRLRGISKGLSEATNLRCLEKNCKTLIKVRRKDAKHIKIDKLINDGWKVEYSGNFIILEKNIWNKK